MKKFIVIATVLVIMVSVVYIALSNTYDEIERWGIRYEYSDIDPTVVREHYNVVAKDKLGNLDTIYFDTQDEQFNFISNVKGWN